MEEVPGAQRRRRVLDLEVDSRNDAMRSLWSRVRQQGDVDMEKTVGQLVRGGQGAKELRAGPAYKGAMAAAERRQKDREFLADYGDVSTVRAASGNEQGPKDTP